MLRDCDGFGVKFHQALPAIVLILANLTGIRGATQRAPHHGHFHFSLKSYD